MKKLPIRIPTAKATVWHKDESKYNRIREKWISQEEFELLYPIRKERNDTNTGDEEMGRHTKEET